MLTRRSLILMPLFIVLCAATAARAESAKEIWDKTIAKIDSVKDYQCILHAFIWDTPTAIKYNPLNRAGKDNREYWYVYKLEMKWKQPGYSMFKVLAADNPGLDLATKNIKKTPGTQIVFGYKDDVNLYGKFPKAGDPVLDKQTEKYIFFMPATAFEGAREIGFNHNIHTMRNYLGHYFKDGRVALDQSPPEAKKDFSFDPEKKILKYDTEKQARPFHRLTFTPADPQKNLGVTKEIMYVNPTTMLPAQIETYEGNTIVMCMYLEDIRLNVGLEDSIWEDYFKNSQIYNK